MLWEKLNITTDLWSSVNSNPYTSLHNALYISKEWELSTFALNTYFPHDHNGESLADAIKDTFQAWELDSKNQVCRTTNNGSNICITSY